MTKGINAIERITQLLEDYALIIVGVVGGIIYIGDQVSTLQFIIILAVSLIAYILYILYDKKSKLQQTDQIIE